jgi:hypothetical protein
MKIKLKDLYCSVIKLDKNGNSYVDNKVKIEDSPWVDFLINKSTKKLYESFYATQKHPEHLNNYWYPIEKFNILVENIRKYGYRNEFCNNKQIQDNLNGDNWPGGKGPIKINGNKIGDGHHRCCILYYLYGGNYEIKINNYLVENIEPIKNK